jgi:ribosomal protein S18 acetylase RimI-like enzyme
MIPETKMTILSLAKTLFNSAEWPYIESSLETCLPQHTQAVFIDGELCAFVIVNRTETGNAFFSYCGVSPRFQGKGYGSKLLKMAIHSIFQVDYPAIQLYVDDWNADARRLYERLDFQQIGAACVAGSECALMELRRPSVRAISV